MKIETIAKTIILDSDGRILLIRRSRTDDKRPGEWDIPGGAVEPGEGLTAAALRETQEEVGLEFQPADLQLIYAGTGPWKDDDTSRTRLVFLAKVPIGAKIKLSFEHDEFEWADIETALKEFEHFFYNPAIKYARDNNLLA